MSIFRFLLPLTDADTLRSICFVTSLVLLASGGNMPHLAADGLTEDEFRDKYGMRAEKHFDKPLDVALCKAIEENDLDAMRKAIAEGADVNARGTGGITPLFWAFPYHRVERFRLLLEAGADPNLPLTGETDILGHTLQGSTVTADAAGTRFLDYFDLVVEHGADLSIKDPTYGPLPRAIIMGLCPDKKHRMQLYIDNGGDVSVTTSMGTGLATQAASRGLADLAIFLLENGVDPRHTYRPGHSLVDYMASHLVHNLSYFSPSAQKGYFRLIDYLESRGISFEEALKKTRFDISLYKALRKNPDLAKEIRKIIDDEDRTFGMGDRRQREIYWPLRRFEEDPRVDFDIDSDNNDGFRYPQNTGTEEKLEDEFGARGKRVSITAPHFTPTRLRLPWGNELYGVGVDPHVALTLDSDSASDAVRLWNVPRSKVGGRRGPIEEGGHRITLGRKYPIADLNYEPEGGGISIFIEAIDSGEDGETDTTHRLTATVSKLSRHADLDDAVVFTIVP